MDLSEMDLSKHINLGDKEEIKMWSEKLKCIESDLIEAVLAIGGSVRRVNDFLILNRKKTN